MKKVIALLRGINVSGQKKIPMADLRVALEKGGIRDAQTYIQSGNIVFESSGGSLEEVSNHIEKIILDSFGFEVPVLVVPQEEVQKIPSSNPFFNSDQDTKKLYVGFLYDQPDSDKVAELKKTTIENDDYEWVHPYIFMKYSEGIGTSKMDNNFFERKLKVRMTTRNWNTILKLSDM